MMNRIACLALLTISMFAGAMAYQMAAPNALSYRILPGANAQESNNVNLGSPFSLRLGEAAVIESEGIAARFERIAEDSRCPLDVECIWQGRAILVISVQVDDKDKQNIILATGDDPHPAAVFEQYSIRLLELNPYPVSDGQIEPGDYIAHLVVSKPSQNSNGVFVRAANDRAAAVGGWNLSEGKGTLVLLLKEDGKIIRTVYRFVPWASLCSEVRAQECISGYNLEQMNPDSLGSFSSAEVINDKLALMTGNRLVALYHLDLRQLKTFDKN